MSDFQKPIERRERPPIEQPQAISPIEKEKNEKEENNLQWDRAISKPLLFATLFSSLKKIVSIFSSQDSSLVLDQELLARDLDSFRDLLLLLCHTDQSHNADYLQKLSELWHTLLEDFNLLDLPERKNDSFLPKIKIFINEILHFPEGEEHSLGFYMTEHAGEDWTPFPFMSLLEALYKEHQGTPTQSVLFRWTTLLSETLLDLKARPEEG